MSTHPQLPDLSELPGIDGGEFQLITPSMLKGKWTMLSNPWNVKTTTLDPRSNLIAVTFDGAGNLTFEVTAGTSAGTMQAQGQGTYYLRKNTRIRLFDGYFTVRLPAPNGGESVNEFYMIKRAPDEFDCIMASSKLVASGTEIAQPNLLTGVLRRCAWNMSDLLYWWFGGLGS